MPSYGVAIIRKNFQGKTWENTYGFDANELSVGGLGDDDLIAIGAQDPVSDAATDVDDAAYNPATSLLIQSLLAYERQWYPNFVTIDRIYVTDSKPETPVVDPNTFFIAALNLPGLRALGGAAETDMAPLSITLMMNKVPAIMSRRQGRSFFRMVLFEQDIRVGPVKGVRFTDAAVLPALQLLNQTALTSSGLGKYLGAGTFGASIGIPRYQAAGNPLIPEGALIGYTPMSAFTPTAPVPRQAVKGRKRPTP